MTELEGPHMCKCGRGPWRAGQRNCTACNREANTKYRQTLRADSERLKNMERAVIQAAELCKDVGRA